jgi:hypothetical protein
MNADAIKEYNKTLKTILIPISVASFPWITKAKTRWKPEGVYSVDQLLDPEDATHAAFIAKLTAMSDKAQALFPKSKQREWRKPFGEHLDRDDEPSGYIVVKASTNAVDREGRPKALPVVDGLKKPVRVAVYSGSKLVCAVRPSVYLNGTNVGIKLYLNAVQVIELQSGDGDGVNLFDEDESADYSTAPSYNVAPTGDFTDGPGADDY